MTGQPPGVWPGTAGIAGRCATRVRRLRRSGPYGVVAGVGTWLLGLWPGAAHASFLKGDALDAVANGVSWLILVLVPIVGITVFWLVHILPERVAEKRRHPQLAAIKTLCLLSLLFGGMLWPLAWLWAYSKPVMHKLAYGTDVDDTPHHGEALTPVADAHIVESEAPAPASTDDLPALRRRIATLEAQLDAQRRTPEGGGA